MVQIVRSLDHAKKLKLERLGGLGGVGDQCVTVRFWQFLLRFRFRVSVKQPLLGCVARGNTSVCRSVQKVVCFCLGVLNP